jgi:hypothetical protein
MRKIFLYLFLSFTFIYSHALAEYSVVEKTENFIILNTGLAGHLSGQIDNMSSPLASDEGVLKKSFKIAAEHCASWNKKAYMFYKNTSENNILFGMIYYRWFDQDNVDLFSKTRFFCGNDENEAFYLYKKFALSTEGWEKFKSSAGNKKYEKYKFYFEAQGTQKYYETVAAKRIEEEKERQKKLELASAEAKKLQEEKSAEAKKLKEEKNEKEKKSKLIELEKQYGKKCQGGLFQKDLDKKSQKFNDCLFEQEAKELAIQKQQSEKLALAEEKKQKAMDEKNKKIALEESEKQKVIQQKRELEQAKIREEQIKISKMKPEDRNAYTCTEKFGFKKGSDKFKDCIFELYKAETELEKLELQKQVAKANAEAARASAEAAKASAERQERLALAQTEAAKMQALASRQQAIAANTADSLALIESGLRMMTPQRPAVAPMRTCSFNGRFMNCY